MKLKTVAILENNVARWKALSKSLQKAGLKVSKANSIETLGKEQMVVLGPTGSWNKNKLTAVREKNAGAWVLEAQNKVKSTAADGVLPMPVSAEDLKARLADREHVKPAIGTQDPGFVDKVTQFHAFSYFKEVLFIEVKRARRYGFPLAMALIEFKVPRSSTEVSDDHPMSLFAAALRRSLRDTDFPIQYTKDRVLVLMPHTDLPGALIVGRRLLERISKAVVPVGLSSNSLKASIGISAGLPGREFGFSELVQRAQKGLEIALEQGGDRIEFVSDAEPVPTTET